MSLVEDEKLKVLLVSCSNQDSPRCRPINPKRKKKNPIKKSKSKKRKRNPPTIRHISNKGKDNNMDSLFPLLVSS